MGKPTGFLEIERHDRDYDAPEDRLKTWSEFVRPLPQGEAGRQAARCMDCGIPFCHTGCPVNNLIPDWNDLVYRDDWKTALDALHQTNNFPEFTGRVCPAPCEASCTLYIQDNPVTIKTIECEIVDRGWQEGWVEPLTAPRGTGKRVAVIGSGPAGLACAQQLARAGGCGNISSWVTEAAPWRLAVPMQSEPVSPPPMTTTCLPIARIGSPCSGRPATRRFCWTR